MEFIKKLFGKLSFLKQHTKLLTIGIIVFFLGLIWHFPLNRLKDTIQTQIYNQTRAIVEIGEIQPALPLGLRLANPKVSNIQLGNKQMAFDLDFFKAAVTPWSALTFAISKSGTVYFSAGKYTFSVSGSAYTSKSSASLSMKLKNLKINDKFGIPNTSDPFGASPGLEMGVIATIQGNLSSDIDPLAAQKGDFSSIKGEGKLTFDSVTLQTPLVSNLDFSRVTADFKADKGVIEFKSIVLSGEQITGKGSGTIKIDPFFPQSQLKLDATLNISNKASQLKDLLQAFGSAVGITIDASGNVAFKINGTVAAPIVKGY